MMNGTEVIEKLKNGNARFVQGKLSGGSCDHTRRVALSTKQTPIAAILSCTDSRVVPEWIFDVNLGELFVVRVAGNVASTEAIASIEYAVLQCGVKAIVVLGHENCGAVMATVSGEPPTSQNLAQLFTHVQPAIDAIEKNATELNAIVKRHTTLSARCLLSQSAIIREAAANGTVLVTAAYYELVSGRVELLERLAANSSN